MGSIPQLVDELPGILQLYSDGSVHRPFIDFSKLPPSDSNANSATAVIFKDIIYQNTTNLSLRLYKPNTKNTLSQLPIVFFFHGGGFCVGSCTWPTFHNTCLKLATELQAVVISPDYRLAPEHRLPAALDDAVSALEWLRDQAELDDQVKREEWLCDDSVNFEKVFVVGDSSGGTMAHHLAVRVGSGLVYTGRFRVRGFVLMGPFFGGVARTKSEAEGPSEELLNLEILDKFWRLALPLGATRDHPLANPFGTCSLDLEQVDVSPILVIVGGAEMMRDRIEDYATRLKELGKEVELVGFEGMQHGFFTKEPHSETAAEVLQVIRQFMFKNSNY